MKIFNAQQAAITDYQITRERVRASLRGAKPADVQRNVAYFDTDQFPVRISIGSVFNRG